MYPVELTRSWQPLGLLLQLGVQLPMGLCFALGYGGALAAVTPLACLFGVPWETLLALLAKHRLATPLAGPLLAVLPVWRNDNTKLRAFCAARCIGVVQGLLGDSSPLGVTAESMRLLDEINVIKGGVFPVDSLTAVAVARAVRRGASMEACDDQGKTALHYAAERGGYWGGLPRTIAALLDAGADANAQDKDGRTALSYAVLPDKGRPSNPPVIKLLAATARADLRVTDSAGRTALMAAPELGLALKKSAFLGATLGAILCAVHVAVVYAAVPEDTYSSEPVRRGVALAGLGWILVTLPGSFVFRLSTLSRRASISKASLFRQSHAADPGVTRILEPRSPSWSQVHAALTAPTAAEHSKHVGTVDGIQSRAAVLAHDGVYTDNGPGGRTGGCSEDDREGNREDGALAASSRAAAVLALRPTAFDGTDLRWLRLRDMVFAGSAEVGGRQLLIFNALFSPLVAAATTQPLSADLKLLLIESVAATGSHGTTHDSRALYRDEFDALLLQAMGEFEVQLEVQRRRLADDHHAVATLLAFPHTTVFTPPQAPHTRPNLFQDAAVGGGSRWAKGDDYLPPGRDDCGASAPSLKGAYHALKKCGAIRGVTELCDLVQCGRHRWFASARPHAYANANKAVFWRHVGALAMVGQAHRRNDEFQEAVAALVAGIPGVVHKRAPVKRCDRVVEKGAAYHADRGLSDLSAAAGLEAVGRVLDIQRCSLCVSSPAAAATVFKAIEAASVEKNSLQVVRRKNGFAAEAEAVGGYRDVKYNLLFQSHGGEGAADSAVVEVQVVLVSYLDVKKRMHAIYRVHRGDFG